MTKTRKKTWQEKIDIVSESIMRCKTSQYFAKDFYHNLFFLNPKIEKYFEKTDMDKQYLALIMGLDHIVGVFDHHDSAHHKNLVRLAETHSKKNLDIHPHFYYYWIDAMVMTLKSHDKYWYKDMEYYVRECLFFPISFMISLYHKDFKA